MLHEVERSDYGKEMDELTRESIDSHCLTDN